MSKEKFNQLKELEKLATKIAKKKAKLEEQLESEKETAKWYDQVLKESGFKRPRDFLKALMGHFGIRTVSLTKEAKAGGKRGPGRPPKPAGVKPASGSKRKRTKVTADLRDKIKADVQAGTSKTAIGKKYGISYLVIKKVESGSYDKL